MQTINTVLVIEDRRAAARAKEKALMEALFSIIKQLRVVRRIHRMLTAKRDKLMNEFLGCKPHKPCATATGWPMTFPNKIERPVPAERSMSITGAKISNQQEQLWHK